MLDITYHLDDFEGPLDLLLALIDKDKIDIHDIPIVSICDQYMAFIEEAQQMDLDIASDFIIMASQLMLIKSKMLLPGRVEKDDPRRELVNQLELYIATKNAAEQLRPMYAAFAGRMEKEMDEIPPEKGVPLGLDTSMLTKALRVMLTRLNAIQPAPEQMITPLITTPIVSVGEKIEEILATLEMYHTASLFFLLKDSPNKADLVAKFMGALELIKIGQILIVDAPAEEIRELEGYDDTAGLTLTFALNPDYIPAEDGSYVSEFENDEPAADEETTDNEQESVEEHHD